MIPPLIDLLQNAEFDIKKEAAWAISNATSGGSAEQIRRLVEFGCIRPLCDLLDAKDARIITVALEGIENILRAGQDAAEKNGEGVSEYAQQVDVNGGLDKIEALQNHTQNEIYEKAMKIIQKYFGFDEEDASIAPAEQANGQFGFGVPAAAPPGGFNFQ